MNKVSEGDGIPIEIFQILKDDAVKVLHSTHGKTDWFQIRKGVHQGYILLPCLFNLCAEYIMQNAGLDEGKTKIKIARRNINNLRYANGTTLMA